MGPLVMMGLLVFVVFSIAAARPTHAQSVPLSPEQQQALETWIETRTQALEKAADALEQASQSQTDQSADQSAGGPAASATPSGSATAPEPASTLPPNTSTPPLPPPEPSQAQTEATAGAGGPGESVPQPKAGATGDLAALVAVLNDPARRQALIDLLEGVKTGTDTPSGTASPITGVPPSSVGTGTATGPQAAPSSIETSPHADAIADTDTTGTSSTPAAATTEQTSVLPQIIAPDITALTAYLHDRYDRIVWSSGVTTQLPQLLDWLTIQIDNDLSGQWIHLMWQIALVILGGFIVSMLGRLMTYRAAKRLQEKAVGSTGTRRVILLVTRLVLKLVPITLFALAAQATMPLIEAQLRTELVAAVVITAVVVQRASIIIRHGLFSPLDADLRLLPIKDDLATALHKGLGLIAAGLIFGYLTVEVARLFGMPPGSRSFLGHILGLLVTIFMIRAVMRLRPIGKRAIRGVRLGGSVATSWATGIQRGLSDIWHLLATVYLLVIYVAWVLDSDRWFSLAGWGTLRSVVLIVVALITLGWIQKWRDAAMLRLYSSPRFDRQMRERGRRYLSLLAAIARIALGLACLVLILESWSLNAVAWVTHGLGGRAVSVAVNLGLALIVAVVLWEVVNYAIQHYLTSTDADGKVVERGQRERTLLPLLRNVLSLFLVVVVALIVLSELGLDIAPLLAGAGVVGLAIGFGSQKLVQDVITGVFNLLEDTIAVGDVIQVGGYSGVVEAMSIRSLRLRDLSGNLHTIPFSVVDTVTNMTKDFSYYVLDMGVAYRENTDEVSAIIKEVGTELQADEEYGAAILEPVEVLGVDALQDSAVVIKARIKTKPIMQWWVGREFLRRLKFRFDERGIEIPFPHMTVYFGVDKNGEAPPAHLHVDRLAAMGARMRTDANTAPKPQQPLDHPQEAPTDTTALLPDPDGDGPGTDR